MHEQQVLANRSREELRVLRHEADLLAELVEIDVAAECPLYRMSPACGVIQPDQQLDQRRLAGTRWSDEGDRLAAVDLERDVGHGRRRRRLVREGDVV